MILSLPRRLLILLTLATTVQWVCADVSVGSVEESHSPDKGLDCVINPSVVADLGSGVPGILSEVIVDRSDFVEAGQVVARLESGVEAVARDLAKVRASTDAEIQLRRVNAAFGKRQHARIKDLFQRKVISTNDLDERKTESRLAQLQLRQALDNRELAALELERAKQVLKRRSIESPISGVVMERFKTVGEYVDEQPVLRVAQLDPLHVEAFVPVERLGEIRPGMRADIWSDAVSGADWEAEVTRVDRVADVASATYGVRLTLPNPDLKVPAGLRCRLAFKPAASEPQTVVSTTETAKSDRVDVTEPQATGNRSAESPVETAVAAEPPLVSDPAPPEPFAPKPPVESASLASVQPADTVDASNTAEPADTSIEDQNSVAEAGQSSADLPITEQVCLESGPLDSKYDANRYARRLRSAGLAAKVIQRSKNVKIGYKIVSMPFAERTGAEAFVAKLKRVGIKDYYLPRRKATPVRVALGLYVSKRVAERRVAKLAKLGVDAELALWTRTGTGYSLSVTGDLTPAAEKHLAKLPVARDRSANQQCVRVAGR